MAGSRLPGPVCAFSTFVFVDTGTSCRNETPRPGPVKRGGPIVDPEEQARRKRKYLDHARNASYAMDAESLLDSSKLSPEAGNFLRMYLEHRVDGDAVARAGIEIAASKGWRELELDTAAFVQKHVNGLRRAPSPKEVADAVRRLIAARLKKGMAFRGALNPVIGGVGRIEVESEARLAGETDEFGRVHVRYEVGVTLTDEYDFANKREGEYDLYRKRLARLLAQNRFCEFEAAYWGEMCPGEAGPRTRLDSKAALFASFMYALEQRGWTPGPLRWSVTIPMRGTFTYRGKSQAAATPGR